MTTDRCLICGERPARKQNHFICHNCHAKIEADKKASRPVEATKYLTYQGHVVGLFPNGNKKLVCRLLKREADNLPKGKTIDLNKWCEGYTRDEIKRFKAAVLKTANA